MQVTVKKKPVFLNRTDVDLSPRVVSKRRIKTQGRLNNGKKVTKNIDVFKIEIACFVDQRVILEEEIKKISVYVSKNPHGVLKVRKNLVNEAVNPVLKSQIGNASLFDRGLPGGSRPRVERADAQLKRQLQERDSVRELAKSQAASRIADVVFDIDRLNQGLVTERFSETRFLTEFNVNQFLSSAKIKNIKNLNQTDEALFGTRKVLTLRRYRRASYRSQNNKKKPISLGMPVANESLESRPTTHVENFRNEFFREVKKGKDPAFNFSFSESSMSVEDRIRGSMNLKKAQPSNLRRIFKKIARQRIVNTDAEDLGFKIFEERLPERNKIYKTTFEMTRPRMERLSSTNGKINLVMFAFDLEGRKVDSTSVEISIRKLLDTDRNPILDFDVVCSRNGRGIVVSKVSNEELRSGKFNLYQKTFSRTQNYKRIFFEQNPTTLLIGPNNSTTIFDGSSQTSNTPDVSKTKTVYQRLTSNFQGRELSNTKVSSVASRISPAEQMTCGVHVMVEDDSRSSNIVITNVSEDVAAILPVKRIARGNRGDDFQPVRHLSSIDDGSLGLEPHKKYFIDREDIGSTDFSTRFSDDDMDPDVIYEYSAFLYNRSGTRQLSSSRFYEKRVPREGLIQASVEVVGGESEEDVISQNNLSEPGRLLKFEVKLTRQEDDVDKILNSIFGDNRSLFNQDLVEVRDASSLLYGVRVHRIDAETGQHVFVGSFRGFRQEDASAEAITDIPKPYRATFVDFAPAFTTQTYKFEPYVIPPPQVLDKVFASLERLIREGNRTNNTLHKLFVGKQKLLDKQLVSKIGSKYASTLGTKGTLSEPAAFLEKNKNNLFLEGQTGDNVYEVIPPPNSVQETSALDFEEKNVEKIKTLDRDVRTKQYIPKNLAQVSFTVGDVDQLVDFYVVVRQYNADPTLIIDGIIHSKDTRETNLSGFRANYVYLSNPKTNIGLVRYYVFGVTKSGSVLGPSLMGGATYEGY